MITTVAATGTMRTKRMPEVMGLETIARSAGGPDCAARAGSVPGAPSLAAIGRKASPDNSLRTFLDAALLHPWRPRRPGRSSAGPGNDATPVARRRERQYRGAPG